MMRDIKELTGDDLKVESVPDAPVVSVSLSCSLHLSIYEPPPTDRPQGLDLHCSYWNTVEEVSSLEVSP